MQILEQLLEPGTVLAMAQATTSDREGSETRGTAIALAVDLTATTSCATTTTVSTATATVASTAASSTACTSEVKRVLRVKRGSVAKVEALRKREVELRAKLMRLRAKAAAGAVSKRVCHGLSWTSSSQSAVDVVAPATAPTFVSPRQGGVGQASKQELHCDSDEDEPELTGVCHLGVRVGMDAKLGDLLHLLLGGRNLAVKSESAGETGSSGDCSSSSRVELGAPPLQSAGEGFEDLDSAVLPRRPTQAQIAILSRLSRGARRFDPAQDSRALSVWSNLLRDMDVRSLRQTHAEVSATFRHGPHAGEPVQGLVTKLRHGYDVRCITPLVVVRCLQYHWVVFGNRRLKALKLFAELSGRPVLMPCLVHDFDAPGRMVSSELLAKLLMAATTENLGVFAALRRNFSLRQ